ncbi:MAG: hypothetical protein A2X82_19175 [Geobacteraceae bacterium GWC2_55_20]|nr:MAG: hypothetical protein A2X82_19175 [Geobacteraceae bacterium GWC2_55_20]
MLLTHSLIIDLMLARWLDAKEFAQRDFLNCQMAGHYKMNLMMHNKALVLSSSTAPEPLNQTIKAKRKRTILWIILVKLARYVTYVVMVTV